MKTIRRLYLYAVAFISMETGLWGAISLLRSFISAPDAADMIGQRAGAISLVLVAVPVFLLHAWLAQRSAVSDDDERISRVRGVFLYGAMLATLIPATQSALALIELGLAALMRIPSRALTFGVSGNVGDELAALFLNGLVAAGLYIIVQSDWEAGQPGYATLETRRLYRYAWVLYGLGLLGNGAAQLLRYALSVWNPLADTQPDWVPTGLALLLVGAAAWVFFHLLTQASLEEVGERRSFIRLGVLYLVVTVALGGGLGALGAALQESFNALLGEAANLQDYMSGITEPVSAGLVFAGIWYFYYLLLAREWRVERPGRTVADEQSTDAEIRFNPYRASLKRLYDSIAAFFGLFGAFLGAQLLTDVLIRLWLRSDAWDADLKSSASMGLAALIVGLPLWLYAWLPLNRRSAMEGDPGDHARRSLVRRGYLFLMIFAAVIGAMFSGGAAVFQIVRAMLGDPPDDLAATSVRLLKTALFFVLLGIYHYRVMSEDNRRAAERLGRRHAQYPVLILAPDEGDFDEVLVAALTREAPEMPVAVHPYSQGAPDETLSAARAVIFPAALLANPKEAVRLWLQTFDGERVVIPEVGGAENWRWVVPDGLDLPAQAARAARWVRVQAEGGENGDRRPPVAMLAVLAVVAGLLLISLVAGLARLAGDLL